MPSLSKIFHLQRHWKEIFQLLKTCLFFLGQIVYYVQNETTVDLADVGENVTKAVLTQGLFTRNRPEGTRIIEFAPKSTISVWSELP